jgi:dipicolinate synthase subunit A
MRSVLIAGGDRRQIALARLMKDKGYHVSLTGFDKLGYQGEAAESPEAVLLPVPYRVPEGFNAPFAKTRPSLEDLVRKYPRSVWFLGGCDAAAREAFGGQIRYIDFMNNEAYQTKNALLTAQAALCAFHQVSETALCDLSCLVTGYGRIAKFLCRLLTAHGAQVTAAARRESDRVQIRAERMNAVHIRELAEALPEADAVFNTVPHHVFDEEALLRIRPGVMYMELASSPFGADMELAKELGVSVRMEQGLPGRYFPVSAASAILHAFESEEI